jgi:hypothetical protein
LIIGGATSRGPAAGRRERSCAIIAVGLRKLGFDVDSRLHGGHTGRHQAIVGLQSAEGEVQLETGFSDHR